MRAELLCVDDKLREAIELTRRISWQPNPEAPELLARAIDEARVVVRRLDQLMATQTASATD